MPEPILPPTKEGFYGHCVRCEGKLYQPAALLYSQGRAPCTAENGCGQYIPRAYIKLRVNQ
jgi:hypothetical protein